MSFPGADDRSDHNTLMMMTIQLHLKRTAWQKSKRLQFELHRLRDPKMAEEFKAMIRVKFELLNGIINSDSDVDINNAVSTFNTAITETAREVLG